MKKLLAILLMASGLFLTSCKDDESNPTEQNQVDAIVGVWVSEGANVAPGLAMAPFNVAKITATFNANKSYTVVQIDKEGAPLTLSGTYTITESTNTDANATTGTQGAKIYTIVANQSSPSAVTATGIYAISGNKMTYEVIQTTPPIAGVNAPTAAGGFGSTTINDTKFAIYIQKYVKQ